LRIDRLQSICLQSVYLSAEGASVEIAQNFQPESKCISLASVKRFDIKDLDYFVELVHFSLDSSHMNIDSAAHRPRPKRIGLPKPKVSFDNFL